MRRTLIAAALLAPLGLLGIRGGPAIGAPTFVSHTATCAFTSYTLNGTFNRLSGSSSFTMHASGSCIGTSSSVTVDLGFNSLGLWSCTGGTAVGSGLITPNNGANEQVNASLVNVGGEYVVELHSVTAAAAGQLATLPIACELGQTQTTIGGTGTLTFST
jgi:hypothetical protein